MPPHSPVWIDDAGLMLGEADTPEAAEDQATAWLLAAGVTPFEARNALRRARIEEVWWSDTAGFAYAEHPDARRVVMVLGLAS